MGGRGKSWTSATWMHFCEGAGERLWLGGRSEVVEIGISMVLASVSELLYPPGGLGCLRLCPFGPSGGLAPGGSLF